VGDHGGGRLGRVEKGLNEDLLKRPGITRAMRAQLRAQARAVDIAEAKKDPGEVTDANRVYLESLKVAGLTPRLDERIVDPIEELLAGLGGSAAGRFDTAQP